jgi:plasmid maintenance system antidote protein VapI
MPDIRLQALKGERKGFWALTVRANWSGAALGVTRTTLSELVNGKRGISPVDGHRLSKVSGGSEETLADAADAYDPAHIRREGLRLKRLA